MDLKLMMKSGLEKTFFEIPPWEAIFRVIDLLRKLKGLCLKWQIQQ